MPTSAEFRDTKRNQQTPAAARVFQRLLEARRSGQARGRQTAPELSAGGQARRHHGGATHMPTSSNAPGGAFRALIGRIIRDIRRKIEVNTVLEDIASRRLANRRRAQKKEAAKRRPLNLWSRSRAMRRLCAGASREQAVRRPQASAPAHPRRRWGRERLEAALCKIPCPTAAASMRYRTVSEKEPSALKFVVSVSSKPMTRGEVSAAVVPNRE